MSNRTSFDNYINNLPPEVQAALFNDLDKMGELGHRLADDYFTYRLEYEPDMITRLLKGGEPWAFPLSDNINDKHLPHPDTGVEDVRYRIVHGHDICNPTRSIDQEDVGVAFESRGLRWCSPAEAVLFLTKNRTVRECPNHLVVFLDSSHNHTDSLHFDFVYMKRNDIWLPYVKFYRHDASERWYPTSGCGELHYDFLGVCK